MGKSQENIRDIIMQAVEAGRISAERTAKDAFKATERRLYGLPTLKIKLEDDLERLEEFKLYGPRERSKSITRFVKNGNRLTPDEIWEAVLMDMEATIAADRYEIETLERALATVRDDPYYRALSGKYLDDVDDRDIAEALECDTSTVWRHRKRLVQRVAVWLYGAEALRYSENANESGTIAITLMSTSSSLSYLRELEAKRRAVNVTISDVNDADAFTLSADNCRVMKMPDLTRNKEQSTITVNIYAPSVVPR